MRLLLELAQVFPAEDRLVQGLADTRIQDGR